MHRRGACWTRTKKEFFSSPPVSHRTGATDRVLGLWSTWTTPCLQRSPSAERQRCTRWSRSPPERRTGWDPNCRSMGLAEFAYSRLQEAGVGWFRGQVRACNRPPPARALHCSRSWKEDQRGSCRAMGLAGHRAQEVVALARGGPSARPIWQGAIPRSNVQTARFFNDGNGKQLCFS